MSICPQDIAAGPGPVIPNFGGSSASFACERANRLFCPGWVSRNWGTVLWPALRQHVVLTVIAVSIGFVLATALALIAYRQNWVERPVLIVTSILYTIPSLALFELLQPTFGLSRVAPAGSGELRVTHATLSGLLGVRRPSVTIAAGTLQKSGAIRYSRGRVVIVDRLGLAEIVVSEHDILDGIALSQL